MKLPRFLLGRLQAWAMRTMDNRPPDFIIGGPDNPYMHRWWIIPRNRFFNIYLHRIVRSDDDRALHDHPWLNASILILGGYDEHRIMAGGIHRRDRRFAGSVKLRRAVTAHRLELLPDWDCVSLFITGPKIRSWGFHCPEQGWVHWERFTAPDDYGQIGKGCEG
jgi:hypothetical protein